MSIREIGNPAFDYDKHGHDYSGHRRTDPRIAEYVNAALGDARTVLNVGAGAGSYEPEDRYVVAVEPSSVMRAQRAANGRTPAIVGFADALPFDDGAFDAAMALVTVHHWPDMEKGLRELRRAASDRVVVMTFDPAALDGFWNAAYFREVVEAEKARYPTIEAIIGELGGDCEVVTVPIPFDCADGFQEAFYGRPEAFLRKEVRQSQSAWGFLAEGVEERIVQAFAEELKSGEWDRKHGVHRKMPVFQGALRLVISRST